MPTNAKEQNNSIIENKYKVFFFKLNKYKVLTKKKVQRKEQQYFLI